MRHLDDLRVCFSTLDNEQLSNIAWHIDQQTPILCGTESNLYADGQGGA